MATPEEARAELRRRAARRELEARRSGSQAAPAQADPARTPQDAPTAQEVASASGATRRPTGDTQFPVSVGKAALPQSINKLMEERGIPGIRRAVGHALDVDLGGGYDPATYGNRADALLGKAVMDIGSGIKQLTVGLDEGELADVEARRALSEGAGMGEGEGFINAGTTGDIAGAMGAFAVPLGAAEQLAVKATTALPRWASKMGAAATVGGAEGAAQPVLEGESRAVNTAIGAALPSAISAAGQAGRKAITHPFELTREAETLVDEGIMPTLGQGADTTGFKPVAKLAKNIEENLEELLSGFGTGRARAEQEVVDALARRAVPQGMPAPQNRPGSNEYFLELDDIFDTAYKDVLDNVEGRMDVSRMASIINDAIEQEGMMVNPSVKRQMERVLYGVLEPHAATGLSGRNARQFQSKIRKQLMKASSVENANENTMGSAEILSRINDELSEMFEEKLGREGAARLRNIDESYANRMLIETAAGLVPAGEDIAVSHLGRALKSRTGRARRIRGQGLGQDIIDPAAASMGAPKGSRWQRALSGVGLMGGIGYFSPSLAAIPLTAAMVGSRRGGAELLFGLGERQKQVRRYMEDVVEPKLGTATALIHSNED